MLCPYWSRSLLLVMNLPFLHVILLPKLSSMNLQNALSAVMVFQTVLLQTKEVISQPEKCGSGFVILESTGLTMFPLF